MRELQQHLEGQQREHSKLQTLANQRIQSLQRENDEYKKTVVRAFSSPRVSFVWLFSSVCACFPVCLILFWSLSFSVFSSRCLSVRILLSVCVLVSCCLFVPFCLTVCLCLYKCLVNHVFCDKQKNTIFETKLIYRNKKKLFKVVRD